MNLKNLLLMMAIFAMPLQAQKVVAPMHFGFMGGLMGADAAREQFNAGRDLFDDHKYTQAEAVLREVIRKYPKNTITDNAHYYLIRALAKQGKVSEAKSEIEVFEKTYRKSEWLADVRELRVQLSKEVPPDLMAALASAPGYPEAFRVAGTPGAPQAPGAQPPTPAPPAPRQGPQAATPVARGPLPGINRGARQEESPEVRVQREALRVLFEADADRAIGIATDRLKADPSDAVTLGNLYMVAQSRSEKALPMLITLARTSPDSKTRNEAVTWISRSRGEKDAIADILISLVPAMRADDDSSALAFALSQVNTTKSIDALASIARDKTKSDRVRTNALSWIAQSHVSNRLALLEEIYKSTMDNARIRRQLLSYVAGTKDPQAVRILSTIATTDPDQNVKLEAVSQLGQIKTPEALKALEDLLMKKP